MTVNPPPSAPSLSARLTAEGFGSFMIVFIGVGAALFTATLFPDPGAGSAVYVAVALAFGFAMTAAFGSFGALSGGHFTPAVTIGAAAAGRLSWRDALPYVLAQVVGAVVASTALIVVGLFGPDAWLEGAQDSGFASTGWGSLSPGGFGMPAAIVIELILTVLLVLVFLSVTHPERATRSAGVTIGLAFTAVQLVAIPIAGGAANPARSIATAIYGGIDPLAQLWVFLVFPALGAAAIGIAYRALFDGAAGSDGGEPPAFSPR
ncbi:aquaporin [Microbacterium sp. NPDC089321]|uniref:aquaporin n=1 Tax=Microbacterium sp. NPDC089321 TaxID=3155183 RepID=UPI003444794C